MLRLRFAVSGLLLFASWSLSANTALGQDSWAPAWMAERGIVFVAPTAGDFRLVVSSLERAIDRAGFPLRVEVVDWASGDIPEDIRNQESHQRAGYYLAQRILAYRKAYPGNKVFLVSHSAGGAVVLAATRWLPANSVDRIILLAPGISYNYDLRRALTVSRYGIDLFYSGEDTFLSAWVVVAGTTEQRGIPAAGEVGFAPVITSTADRQLYRKLRQYPWREEYGNYGYFGGHFGLARRTFISEFVLPMFLVP